MTRKDYQLIASVIARVQGYSGNLSSDSQTLNILTHELSDALKKDNPRFDSNKFKKAAGLKLI